MLVITVNQHEKVVLERDGIQLGTIDIAMRKDRRIRVAIDLPRDITIRRVIEMPQMPQQGQPAPRGGSS